MKQKKYNEALVYFNKAIEFNINFAEAYGNRGSAREMLRDFDGACKDWTKAASLGISNPSQFLAGCE